MTEYSITLPKQSNVHAPNLYQDSAKFNGDYMETALKSFDTDGKKGLSSDELLQAFDYFVNKEKEIAVTGRKGDGVITSKDIEHIVKTDSKFNEIRKMLQNDNAVVDFLSNIVMSLSTLVNMDKSFKVTRINSRAIECTDDDYRMYEFKSNRNVTNTQTNIKVVDGKKVQICSNDKGEKYVKSENGKYIYTTPAYVAKCLGYQTESTWGSLDADKYYEDITVSYGPRLKNIYKSYKLWNEEEHCFKNGETKMVKQTYFRGSF